MVNKSLREHVTSVGFSLTLSKRQIDTLVLLHHFKTWDRFYGRMAGYSHYCSTAQALISRGLMRDFGPGVPYVKCELCEAEFCGHRLTKAGSITAVLLQEAGIYQEVLDRYCVEPKGDAA